MSHNFWVGFEKQASILTSAGNLIGRMGGRVVNRGAQVAAAPGKFTGAVRQGYAAARAPVAAQAAQAAAPVAAQVAAPVAAQAAAPVAAQAAAPVAAQAAKGSRRFVGARPRPAQGAARNRPTATEYIKRNPQAALPAAAPVAAANVAPVAAQAAAPVAAQATAPAKGSGVLHAIKEKGKKLQGRGTDIVGGGLAGAGGMYLMSGDSGQQSAYGY